MPGILQSLMLELLPKDVPKFPSFKTLGRCYSIFLVFLHHFKWRCRQMETIQGPTPPLTHSCSVLGLTYTWQSRDAHESFRARIRRKTLLLICMKGENSSIALILPQRQPVFVSQNVLNDITVYTKKWIKTNSLMFVCHTFRQCYTSCK